jgi:hypothetical protein
MVRGMVKEMVQILEIVMVNEGNGIEVMVM